MSLDESDCENLEDMEILDSNDDELSFDEPEINIIED